MPILAAFSWAGFGFFLVVLAAITLFVSFGGVEEIKEDEKEEK